MLKELEAKDSIISDLHHRLGLAKEMWRDDIEEVKEIVSMTEDEFTDKNAYKLLKTEIFRIFGPRPEDAVERALSRVLVGKPSTLARQLAGDICKQKLNCPCCPAVVTA